MTAFDDEIVGGAGKNSGSAAPRRGAASGALTIITQAPAVAKVGKPYQAELRASGGIPPYVWSITKGKLPSGLHLAGNTISVIPNSPIGCFYMTVEIIDLAQTKTSKELSMQV